MQLKYQLRKLFPHFRIPVQIQFLRRHSILRLAVILMFVAGIHPASMVLQKLTLCFKLFTDVCEKSQALQII
jgi:hypothetical protein